MNKKLTPKQWVLVRDFSDGKWALDIFSHYEDGEPLTLGGCAWAECISYKGNEHLRGTTNEYKEPYEPKDGEFVYVKCRNCREYIFIKGSGNEEKTDYYFSYNLDDKSCGSSCKVCSDYEISEIRSVTEEEKQFLLDKLHEAGKDWDAENKKIVDWEWKPKEGEIIYYPYFSDEECIFKVDKGGWLEGFFQKFTREHIFRSRNECQLFCDKLNKAIKNVNLQSN